MGRARPPRGQWSSGKEDKGQGESLGVGGTGWEEEWHKHDVKRFVQFATRVWDVDPAGKTDEEVALEGINAMQAFFVSIGMPATLEQGGGKKEDIPVLAANVVNGHTGHFVYLEPAQIEEILAIASEK